ncbi:transposase zinc-binding domain-containing protein [Thomasclavelia saccharogumia]|uniref:transposase zinc-binding domain-containing protein n=1 Tax=Thomasclavelia saccharogumia TaxID=341225 RepID=UPI000A056784
MILCSSIHLGYDFFVCPNCGKETIVAHTCSSKYCTKCGSKSSQRHAAYVSSMAFKSKHHHIIFTIPAQLRFYFIKKRTLLDGLFVVARNTLASFFNDSKYRRQKHLKKISSIIKKQ